MKKSLSKNSIQTPVTGEMHFSRHKELDAAPYILNDEKIRRDWDYIHEQHYKKHNLRFFISNAKPIEIINDNVVYSFQSSKDSVEYIVFDNPISTKATRYLFYLKLLRSKSRNGLFKTSAQGWYPSRAWQSKNSKSLGTRFVIKMLEYVFEHLDADFIVSDFMQTNVFTERFKEFLLPRLAKNRVFVGLSFNKEYPFCIPIENEQELIIANSLISRGGAYKEYAYKSLFALSSNRILHNVITDKTLLVDFTTALDTQLFIKSNLDLELKKALDRGELLD